MATIIDAFVVSLGLEGRLFRRGMDEAARSQRNLSEAGTRANRERERQERQLADQQRRRQAQQDARVKSTVEGFRRIRNELLGMAALFTAGVGIKDFFGKTINDAANLGYLSANLKMTTKELTAFQRASERAGGSGDGIIAQLKESADTLAQLKSGLGPNEGLQNFFRWGGNADELKDGNTYLLARSRIIHGMFQTDPAQAALIAKQMGISEDQFNFLKQGPNAVMDMVRAQEKYATITEKDAAAALALKNKMLDLRDALQSTATRIVLNLAPVLERLFKRLEDGAAWVVEHQDDISRWLESAISWMVKGATAADKFAQMVGGWSNVFLGLLAIPVVSGLMSIATAIAAIAAAGLAIPALVAALGALAAYGGYKGAEWLFGKKVSEEEKALRARDAQVRNSGAGTGSTGKPTKEQMKAEAARQWAAAGLGGTSGKASAETVMQKLMAQGWTAEQAAGITGSFAQESGLDASARNPTSGAYGIGQWLSKDRVSNFEKFSGRKLEGSTLDQQLAFFNHEVTNGSEQRAGRLLRGAATAEDAARIHSEAYERPGAEEANISRRQRLAGQYAAGSRMANAAGVGVMPSGATASASGARAGSTSTMDVRVDKIEVHTQATDADAIAQSIRPAVERYTFANQANTGMN